MNWIAVRILWLVLGTWSWQANAQCSCGSINATVLVWGEGTAQLGGNSLTPQGRTMSEALAATQNHPKKISFSLSGGKVHVKAKGRKHDEEDESPNYGIYVQVTYCFGAFSFGHKSESEECEPWGGWFCVNTGVPCNDGSEGCSDGDSCTYMGFPCSEEDPEEDEGLDKDIEIPMPAEMTSAGHTSQGNSSNGDSGPSGQPQIGTFYNQDIGLGKRADGKFQGSISLQIDSLLDGGTAVPGLANISEHFNDLTVSVHDSVLGNRRVIIGYATVIEILLNPTGMVINTYSEPAITPHATDPVILPASKLKSVVAVSRKNLDFKGTTYTGISSSTKIAGEPIKRFEIYKVPNSSGGGESIEIHDNRLTHQIVTPWVTGAPGQPPTRSESTSTYLIDAEGEYHLTSEVVDTYEKISRTYNDGYSPPIIQTREHLLTSVRGVGAEARTTQYFYNYTTATPSSPYVRYWGFLKARIDEKGAWVRYAYDQFTGETIKVYRPWRDTGMPSTSSATRAQLLAAIEAVPESECVVDTTLPTSLYDAVSGVVTTRTIGGVIVSSELNGRMWLIDSVTGNRVDETIRRVMDREGHIISETRSAVTIQEYGSTQAPVYDRLATNLPRLYDVGPDGIRTSYAETKSGTGASFQLTKTETQGTYARLAVPNYSTRRVTISDQDGVVLREEEHAHTGAGFSKVSETTYSKATVSGVEVYKTFEDGVEVSSKSELADGTQETVGPDGVKSSMFTDPDTQEVTKTQHGMSAVVHSGSTLFTGADLVTKTTQLPLPTTGAPRTGYLQRVTVTAGAVTRIQSETEYNSAGEIIKTTDAQGIVTYYSQGRQAAGWVETQTGPGVFTRTVTSFLDGSVKSITGTVVPEYHDYQVSNRGHVVHTVRYGAPESRRYVRTHTDVLGRPVRHETPAFKMLDDRTSIWTENQYDLQGHVIKITRSGLFPGNITPAPELMEYNEMGALLRRGLDLNGNGVLDVASNEPLTETLQDYVNKAGHWWRIQRTRVYETDAVRGFRETIQSERLGDGPAEMTEVISASGAVSRTTTTVDRVNRRITSRSEQAGITGYSEAVQINGMTFFNSTPASAIQNVTVFNDFRQPTSTVMTGGTVSYAYDSSGRLQSETTTSGSVSRVTSYTYYPSNHAHAGKLQTRTAPHTPRFFSNTSDVTYEYDDFGRVEKQSGSGTYPVKFGYDVYGQRTSMTTYQTFTSWDAGGAVTYWIYDESSGLLSGKEDAAGGRVAYEYHPGSNLLHKRHWARLKSGETFPLATTYLYDAAERLSGIDYADDTPDVAYTYRRDGSIATVVDAAGTHTYSDHDRFGRPRREVITGDQDDLLAGLDLRSSTDSLGRNTGQGGSYQPPSGSSPAFPTIVLPTVSRGYDQSGRMSRVSSAGNVTDISYEQTTTSSTRTLLRHRVDHPELDLTTVEVSTLAQGMISISHETLSSPSVFKQTRSLGSVGTSGGQPQASINQVDPHFGIGAQAAASRWLYTYDTRGQVTSARRQYATDSGGTTFADLSPLNQDYSFNDIGGRSGDNALNQTINRTSPGKLVTGLAHVSQAVSVNSTTATRHGPWYTRLIPSVGGGSPAPQWSQVDVHAEDSSATTETNHSGKVFVPPASYTHAYDADGNTLQADGRWNLVWDAENRLAQAITTTAAASTGVPDLRLTFGYDARSRRISKKVEKRANPMASWEMLNDMRFIYEGWNLVAEVELCLTANDVPVPGNRPYLRRSYVWGPDLSGNLDGAGGVGGLLGMTRHERAVKASESYWAANDLNGNVIGLSSSTVARYAVYEYDASGSPVRINEPEPELNPVRFSSKYTDLEIGLCYFGHRYYSPETDRWLSRDPIAETGGLNLYGMANNDLINRIDILGMQSTGFGTTYNYCPSPPSIAQAQANIDLAQANHQFDMALLRYFVYGPDTLFFGPNEPWTKEMKKKPVYERLRQYMKTRSNQECNKKWNNDGQGFVGRELKWDDNADDQPWYQPLRDGLNYVFGFELKSTGSVYGEVKILSINCCCGSVTYRVNLSDKFRAGSMARIPARSPVWPNVELLPDFDGPGGFLFKTVAVNWEWEETIKLAN